MFAFIRKLFGKTTEKDALEVSSKALRPTSGRWISLAEPVPIDDYYTNISNVEMELKDTLETALELAAAIKKSCDELSEDVLELPRLTKEGETDLKWASDARVSAIALKEVASDHIDALIYQTHKIDDMASLLRKLERDDANESMMESLDRLACPTPFDLLWAPHPEIDVEPPFSDEEPYLYEMDLNDDIFG